MRSVLALLALLNCGSSSTPTALDVWRWREASREAVEHAFGAYMQHGWPSDEVMPLSCLPRPWDARKRGTLDDVLGGYGLTLVDSLDTLALLGDLPAFRCAVSRIVATVGFDRDVDVSVFEASIRVVGGLLSAHLLSVDPALGIWATASAPCARPGAPPGTACAPGACLPRYEGQLLSMAAELARRLLPAFATPSGLPYHRVNLRTGAPDPVSRETCTAAAGTFLVEFGLLSRLTGDPAFEAVARRANTALWTRRSALGLVGSAIDAVDGGWRTAHTGVGSGIDSWLEYLLKGAVLLRDDGLQAMADGAAAAVAEHLDFGGLHLEVSFSGGRSAPREPATVSALQAFYPGIEVLGGAVRSAQRHLAPLAALWRKYNATPELYHVEVGGPPAGLGYGRDAPLRPELVEGTYHLFTATRDASLLNFASAQLEALNARSRTACGFAAIADVTTGRLDDRMDSYFLAETGKYLFLTFDYALKHWHEGAPLEAGRSAGDAGDSGRPRSNSSSGGGGGGGSGAPVPGAGASPRARLRARANQLFPHAHPLAHARYDDDRGAAGEGGGSAQSAAYEGFSAERAPAEHGGGSNETVASLPLNELFTLFTTEGHALTLGGWPVVSVARPGGGAPAPAPCPGAHCCPVLAPARHAAPPPRTPPAVAELVEALASTASPYEAPPSVPAAAVAAAGTGVCSVEELRAALAVPRLPAGELQSESGGGGPAGGAHPFPSWASALFSPAELLTAAAFDGLVAPGVLSAVARAKAGAPAPLPALTPSIFESVMRHFSSLVSRGAPPTPAPAAPAAAAPAPPPLQALDFSSAPLNAALVNALQRPVVTRLTYDLGAGAWRGSDWAFEGARGDGSDSFDDGGDGGGAGEESDRLEARIAAAYTPETLGLLSRLFGPPALAAALTQKGGALLGRLLRGTSVRCFPFQNACHTTLFFTGLSPLVRVVARGGGGGDGGSGDGGDALRHESAARALWDARRNATRGAPLEPPVLLLAAASAQFGPLLTAAGMHALRPALAHPQNGCAPGGVYLLAGGEALAPLPPASTAARPAVAIAWRGGCTFAEKARLAQAGGASALLVLDGSAPGAAPGVEGAEPLAAPDESGAGGGSESAPPLFAFALADDGPASEAVRIPATLLAREHSAALWGWLAPVAVAGSEGVCPEGAPGARYLSLFAARAPRGDAGGGNASASPQPLTSNVNELATSAVRLALEQRDEESTRLALAGTAPLDAAFTLAGVD